jgi:hypothetical protein
MKNKPGEEREDKSKEHKGSEKQNQQAATCVN